MHVSDSKSIVMHVVEKTCILQIGSSWH